MLYDKEIYLNAHRKSIELAILELFLARETKNEIADDLKRILKDSILNWHSKKIKEHIKARDISTEINYSKKMDLQDIDRETQFTRTILKKRGKRYDTAGERQQIERELKMSISNLNHYLKNTFGISIYKGGDFPDSDTKFMPFILSKDVVEKLDGSPQGGKKFYEEMQHRQDDKSNRLSPLGKGLIETSNKLKDVSESFSDLIEKEERLKIKAKNGR